MRGAAVQKSRDSYQTETRGPLSCALGIGSSTRDFPTPGSRVTGVHRRGTEDD
jgi:hypothetical protein